MHPAERRQLAHRLAAMDYPRSRPGTYARRRLWAIAVLVVACAVLVAWIVVLAMSLHRSFHTHHWRGAWVVSTSSCCWRSPRPAGPSGAAARSSSPASWSPARCCAATRGSTSCSTRERPRSGSSVASALFVELPMPFPNGFNGARRLIRLSALLAICLRGCAGRAGRGERACEPARGQPPAALGGFRSSASGPPARRFRSAVISLPWLPISPRRPRLTPSSSRSGRTPTRGCVKSWPRWCANCTCSPATSS